MIDRVFGFPMREGLELEKLLRVRIQPGWKGLLLPRTISGLCGTDTFDHEPPRGDEYGWQGAIDWLALILSVHWTRPEPYLYQARIGCFDPRWSERSGQEPVKRALAVSKYVAFNPPQTKTPIYSDFLIDPAGQWGLIECWDEQVSLLLADAQLYHQFVAVLGGLPAIQAACQTAIVEKAAASADDDPDSWPDGEDEAELATWRPLYEKIGWAWPFADHIRPENYPVLARWRRDVGLAD